MSSERPTLAGTEIMPGVRIMPNVVPLSILEMVLRELWLALTEHCPSRAEFEEWHRTKCWIPWMRESDIVKQVAQWLPSDWKRGVLCEPQIIFHFPDRDTTQQWWPHLDEEPPWAAEGQKYRAICGVALTDSTHESGGLQIWRENPSAHLHSIHQSPGSAVCMEPHIWHTSGPNVTGHVRIMLYFRYLEFAGEKGVGQ